MPDTLEHIRDLDGTFDGFSSAKVAIVVTNPHLEDNPIVYVNEAFTRFTVATTLIPRVSFACSLVAGVCFAT